MKKTLTQKNKTINALIFILGVIVTIIFNKISDNILPNDPVFIKEYTDTIRIVHNYDIPNELDNDSIKLGIENKIKNLELLNSYDKQIKERVSSMQNDDGVIPNLILTGDKNSVSNMGYIYGSSSGYFTSDCPNLSNHFLEIEIDFFNPIIIKDIACLRVNILRFENIKSIDARTLIFEEFYEVKPQNNIIRISNDFSKGKYKVLYGFILKNELAKTHPTFYFKKCILTK